MMDQGDGAKAGGKNWRLGAAIVIAAALAVGLYYFSGVQNFSNGNQAPASVPTNVPKVERPLVYPKFSPTVSSSTTSSTNPDKVVTEKLTGRKESVTIYNINAENWAYIPDRLVVKKGEQININFTAVDRDYDLAIASPIGAYASLKKGEMAIIGFGADKMGTYEMRCQKICPDGKDMKGEIVIIK